MADSSLDDFFAKKDKSKKKSKAKMTPGDVLAKADEPKKVKKKKEKEQPGGLGLNAAEDTSRKTEDDEWEDFAEQKEVDYSGLRIQTLQIKEEEEKEAAESEGEGEGGEREEGREAASGPWNASGAVAPPPPVAAVAAPPEPEEKKENTAPKKYVPPAQRNAASSAASAAANPISRRGNKKAPNIQSEVDFPTLGGAPAVSGGSAWGSKKYENSGTSDIESNPGQRRGVNLSLENKFSALQD
ncbi:protein CDV3 homolog A-like [Babylonia areolata]|uniref:protein CDV3 homolog A-like n=1 Tax=Babylonia areolata TaxID=304850 RepID=UPI003FD5B58F